MVGEGGSEGKMGRCDGGKVMDVRGGGVRGIREELSDEGLRRLYGRGQGGVCGKWESGG